MNKKLSQIGIVNKVVAFVFILFAGCRENIKYQKIILDYKAGTLEILSNNYQFDSLSVFRNDTVYYSLYKKKEEKGEKKIRLDNSSPKYNISNNLTMIKDCSDLYLFIRIKSNHSKEVQFFDVFFKPCLKKSIEIRAERPSFP